MINKDVRKSLARKNVYEILIWVWNNPGLKVIHRNLLTRNQIVLLKFVSLDLSLATI